jgi:hypothetical protein
MIQPKAWLWKGFNVATYLRYTSWGILLSLWLFPGTSWADGKDTVANIARAWKDRERKVLSLDCKWSAEEVCGAKTCVYQDEKGKQFAIPNNDLIVNLEYRFRLKGQNKMRYEFTGPQPIQETRSFETREYISVTDGDQQKSFYGKDNESDNNRFAPIGFINKENTLPEMNTIHLRPLLFLYRAFASDIASSLDLARFSPKGNIIIAGRECLLLERINGGEEKLELVIDMNRECIPVRFRRLLREKSKTEDTWNATSLIAIDYGDRGNGQWSPMGWKTAILGGGGKVREQMTATVKRFQINADIPESVFRFDFPVGSIVRNWKSDEYYLIRSGGEKRYITEAESDARVPYKSLLTTNAGESLSPSHRSWRAISIIVSGAILLMLLALLIYRRIRFFFKF